MLKKAKHERQTTHIERYILIPDGPVNEGIEEPRIPVKVVRHLQARALLTPDDVGVPVLDEAHLGLFDDPSALEKDVAVVLVGQVGNGALLLQGLELGLLEINLLLLLLLLLLLMSLHY